MSEKLSPFRERLSSTPPAEFVDFILESNKSTEELTKLIKNGNQDEETLKKARTLIESGFANIDAISQNESGDCLIHTAVKKGSDKMVALLVEYGCDVNVQNKAFGLTPLHLAVDPTIVNLAINEENQVLKELLKAENIDFNAKDTDGKTPDTRALLLGNMTAFQTLFDSISKKEMKEKQEKEWQQKWDGNFEYENPNKTEWEKEFDKLPKNSTPLDSGNPFDEIEINKAFDVEIASKAFDVEIATHKTQIQTPKMKSGEITRKPISVLEEPKNTVPDNTKELLQESQNEPKEKSQKNKEGFASMFLRKISEFVGLTEKEDKISLIESQERSDSLNVETLQTAKTKETTKTRNVSLTEEAVLPSNDSEKSDDDRMFEVKNSSELKAVVDKMRGSVVGNEVESTLNSHSNSVTHSTGNTRDSARQ
jgi:hypothetical protein